MSENKTIQVKSGGQAFVWASVMFILTLGLGILSTAKLNQILKLEEVALAPISFFEFVFYFFLATFFILFVAFFPKLKKRKELLFRALFVLAVFGGGLILLSLWLPTAWALVILAFLLWIWIKRPLVVVHNLAMVLGMAGIGPFLGSRITPEIIVLLLIVLSVYDFIAVYSEQDAQYIGRSARYKTRHMIKMVKEMISMGAILALIAPQELSDWWTNVNKVRSGDGRFLLLGSGDAVFPLLLVSSLVSESLKSALVVAAFALLGLFAVFLLFSLQKKRRALPALPPIAFFSILGYLVSRLL